LLKTFFAFFLLPCSLSLIFNLIHTFIAISSPLTSSNIPKTLLTSLARSFLARRVGSVHIERHDTLLAAAEEQKGEFDGLEIG